MSILIKPSARCAAVSSFMVFPAGCELRNSHGTPAGNATTDVRWDVLRGNQPATSAKEAA